MSAENENKEIIEEVCKALDNIYEAKQMLSSLERTLNYIICGLFECEGDVVSKDYLLYDLNDDLKNIVSDINRVFETMPLFDEESK